MTQGWETKERLDHVLDAVVDSGDCGTVPTTVVDFSGGEAEIVRRGPATPRASSSPGTGDAAADRPGCRARRTVR